MIFLPKDRRLVLRHSLFFCLLLFVFMYSGLGVYHTKKNLSSDVQNTLSTGELKALKNDIETTLFFSDHPSVYKAAAMFYQKQARSLGIGTKLGKESMDKAEEYWEAFLTTNPTFIQGWRNLIDIRHRLGRPDQEVYSVLVFFLGMQNGEDSHLDETLRPVIDDLMESQELPASKKQTMALMLMRRGFTP